eukprot:5215722-Karenia_brevis.AAC.1
MAYKVTRNERAAPLAEMKLMTSSLGPMVLKVITCGAPPGPAPEFVSDGTRPGCVVQSSLYRLET